MSMTSCSQLRINFSLIGINTEFFVLDLLNELYPLKRQSHKMAEHIQTIRQLLPTNYMRVSDHFVRLAPNGMTSFV